MRVFIIIPKIYPMDLRIVIWFIIYILFENIKILGTLSVIIICNRMSYLLIISDTELEGINISKFV
jgi:hypothetical protein